MHTEHLHKNDVFEAARKSRRSVAVIATGRSALTILGRAKRAGYPTVSVFETAAELLDCFDIQRHSRVLAVLEPEKLSREQLYSLDRFGAVVIGVEAHALHRSWATMLPLHETVWLYSTPAVYRKLMRGYEQRLDEPSCD